MEVAVNAKTPIFCWFTRDISKKFTSVGSKPRSFENTLSKKWKCINWTGKLSSNSKSPFFRQRMEWRRQNNNETELRQHRFFNTKNISIRTEHGGPVSWKIAQSNTAHYCYSFDLKTLSKIWLSGRLKHCLGICLYVVWEIDVAQLAPKFQSHDIYVFLLHAKCTTG